MEKAKQMDATIRKYLEAILRESFFAKKSSTIGKASKDVCLNPIDIARVKAERS